MQQTQQPETSSAATMIIMMAGVRNFMISIEGSRKGLKNLTRKKPGNRGLKERAGANAPVSCLTGGLTAGSSAPRP
jgi:hypothetical protein